MDLVPRNIVVLFDKNVTQEFIALSEEINNHVPSDIVLNTHNMIPHATLYTTNYPAKNEARVVAVLKKITGTLRPFSMRFTTPVVDMLGVWINAEKTAVVQKTHEQMVDALHELRDGFYDKGELVAIGNNKKRQESLVKYGMWAAKELYIPHVTLSRPKDPNRLDEALSFLPKHTAYEAKITEIAYVERGPFGTCKKIIEKFPLM